LEGGYQLTCDGGAAGDTIFGDDGNAGDDGIIRIETFNLTRNFTILTGRAYHSLPGLVDSDGTDLSTLRISRIGTVEIPADAGANTAQPDVIIPPGVANPVEVEVTATNVTPGQAAVVRINYGGAGGQVIETTTTLLAGTAAESTATVDVTLPAGAGTIAAILRTDPFQPQQSSLKAAAPALEKMRLTLDGEPVESIERVHQAGVDGTRIDYVTASGNRASRWLSRATDEGGGGGR
jgi:hypothetical protein